MRVSTLCGVIPLLTITLAPIALAAAGSLFPKPFPTTPGVSNPEAGDVTAGNVLPASSKHTLYRINGPGQLAIIYTEPSCPRRLGAMQLYASGNETDPAPKLLEIERCQARCMNLPEGVRGQSIELSLAGPIVVGERPRSPYARLYETKNCRGVGKEAGIWWGKSWQCTDVEDGFWDRDRPGGFGSFMVWDGCRFLEKEEEKEQKRRHARLQRERKKIKQENENERWRAREKDRAIQKEERKLEEKIQKEQVKAWERAQKEKKKQDEEDEKKRDREEKQRAKERKATWTVKKEQRKKEMKLQFEKWKQDRIAELREDGRKGRAERKAQRQKEREERKVELQELEKQWEQERRGKIAKDDKEWEEQLAREAIERERDEKEEAALEAAEVAAEEAEKKANEGKANIDDDNLRKRSGGIVIGGKRNWIGVDDVDGN
jgi:hypothetical protein